MIVVEGVAVQIVVKTTDAATQDACPLIEGLVLTASPELSGKKKAVRVTKVFPNVTRGNRARMYTVSLPEDVSDQEVDRIVDLLGKQNELEYAQVAAPKRPMED